MVIRGCPDVLLAFLIVNTNVHQRLVVCTDTAKLSEATAWLCVKTLRRRNEDGGILCRRWIVLLPHVILKHRSSRMEERG